MPKTKKVQSEKHDHQKEELENQLKRALADYQNLERRVQQERQLLSQLTSAIVIEKFLPVLDNLESAQNHLNDEGLAMVLKQFQDILASEGVVQIESEGQEFDPNLHEASEVTEGEDDGKIVRVLAKGYMLADKVLRPAKVIVTKKNLSSAQEETGENQAEDTEEEGEDMLKPDNSWEEDKNF